MLKDKTMVKKLHSSAARIDHIKIYIKRCSLAKKFFKNMSSLMACPVVFQQAKLFQNKKI